MRNKDKRSGFTLLEIILVVALISILAGIVILAINPSKQIADTNNAQRRADVNTIINAVYQYAIDNNGQLPASITTTQTEICRTNAVCGMGFIDLSVLTFNQEYIPEIPIDPTGSSTAGTGYTISRTVNNRVIVAAPHAQNTTISIIR